MTPSPAIQHGQRFTFSGPNDVDRMSPVTFPSISQSPVARTRTSNRPAYVELSDVSDRRREDRSELRKVASVEHLPPYASILRPRSHGHVRYNKLACLVPGLRLRPHAVHFHPEVAVYFASDTGIEASVSREPLTTDSRNSRQTHFRRSRTVPCLTLPPVDI